MTSGLPEEHRVGVLDGHNDLPWTLRDLCDYDLDAVSLVSGEPRVQTDFPRLSAGGVTGQFWSVFVPCSLTGQEAVQATYEQIDFVHRFAAAYPDRLALCRGADDVEAAVASGRVASLIGMEGGHSIDSSLDILRSMHERGARYMTLTHNENVPWADSATDVAVLGGLSDLGREIVREMNRLGVFVDLSHVSDGVMHDALATTTAPVLFSHSSARALASHPRNVPDEVLVRLAGNGGVCMVSFVSFFVSQAWVDWFYEALDVAAARGLDPRRFEHVDPVLLERRHLAPPPPTVADVADHVDHVREVAGLDHVGLGGDYDGVAVLPRGLEDVSTYPALLEALGERGWSEDDLAKLTCRNILRVMRDVEAGARELQQRRGPSLARIEDLDG